MAQALVTVVIPIHLEKPSELETISLAQTLAVLGRYPLTFMAPLGLDTSWYEDYCRGKATVYIERFQWKGRDEYCALLTSAKFYHRFLGYEYMLICHLDAFVFRDELEQWCQQGYDYIGSVIYNHMWDKSSRFQKLIGFAYPEYMGNGGFALKKISSFYRITSRFRLYMELYIWIWRMRKAAFIDDIFLSQHFPKLQPSFRIPPKALAQRFGAAYENWEEENLPFTNQDNDSLPFGMHGWILCHPDYWKPCIHRYGYNL